MRELGSYEKARTSHNGNSRKFVVNGQCPRRQRRATSLGDVVYSPSTTNVPS
jgi:hypothetical protein